MRSFGPEPLTLLRFTPSSRANLRTDGEACGSWPGLRLGSSSAAAGAGRDAGAAAAGASAWASAWAAGAAAAAAVLAAGAAAAAAPSTTTTTEPLATLSPTLTFTSLTTPPCEAGISIEALSDSTVIRLCSALIVSPTATMTSMTSTSLKSPMSGTLI
ncbi:hypothetical protein G6F57_017086 [Rhizopus arrhizus]|nr:hypothetical protein G6F57_017086 [Rhizopus arrhizus]